MLLATYNLFEFGSAKEAAADRRGDVIEAINEIKPEILLVQEIAGDHALTLDALAADTGLHCRFHGIPAFAAGDGKFAVGVLWNPTVRPTGFRQPGLRGFQRRLACLTVEIDGISVGFASYHAHPAAKHQRVDDALSAAMCLTRASGIDAVVLGGDFNDTSAARDLHGDYLDPDWTHTNSRNDNFVYETDSEYTNGVLRVRPARDAAEQLQQAGLCDAAEFLQATPQATTGHWPGDWAQGLRKDRFHLTVNLRDSVRELATVDNATTRRASDHLPAVLDFHEHVSALPVTGKRNPQS
ncbi:hypothetical protein Ahu01nite_079070 [Winogradskya humida]|uniref:Endonuclease/exonuclease/phosphatase domain-containing protein n=2 Tax=Winogradskya humida TaxID=113566 RepID=A0ABQ4A1S5_9ACTN|nr:hypothetical protein Ahu01nite_079070 [Actinoplanes humidus]